MKILPESVISVLEATLPKGQVFASHEDIEFSAYLCPDCYATCSGGCDGECSAGCLDSCSGTAG